MAELEKTGENTVKLEVEIPAEEVRAKAAEVYAEVSRTVKVPGFRKGKVPRRILERDYASHVLQTVVDELVPLAFERTAQELGVEAVASPRYDVKEVSAEGPISFTAEVAVFPEIELPDYSGFVVKRDRHEVTDQDVEAALENLRQAHARLEPVEGRGSLDGDLVILKFLAGEPPEGFSQPTVGVWAAVREKGDPFAEQVMGKAAGDTFPLRIEYPADYPSERHAGTTVEAPVEVAEVKKRVPPELDEDFAREVGEDSLEALRAQVKQRLEVRAEERSYVVAYRRLLDDIAARAKVPLDDSFLEQFVTSDDDEKLPEADRAQRLEEARRDLKLYFLVRALARREEVEVTAEEVREVLAAAAARAGAPPERPAAVYDRLLNEKLAARLIPREEQPGEGGTDDASDDA
jgi:trigger factor